MPPPRPRLHRPAPPRPGRPAARGLDRRCSPRRRPPPTRGRPRWWRWATAPPPGTGRAATRPVPAARAATGATAPACLRAPHRAGRRVDQPGLLGGGGGRRRVGTGHPLHRGQPGRPAGRGGPALPGQRGRAAGRGERRGRPGGHRHRLHPPPSSIRRSGRAGRPSARCLPAAHGRHRARGRRPRCATCGRRCAGPGTPRATTSWCWPPTRRRSPSGWCRWRAAQGCPYSRADAGWGRTVLFPALSTALREVAGADRGPLPRPGPGHRGPGGVQPGHARAGVAAADHRRPEALVHGGLDAVGYHLAQESFHPNAAAHAEFGRCLGAFVRSGDRAAACVPGPDGRLRLDRAAPSRRRLAGAAATARPGRAGGR